jgi:hypothetical protein
MFVVTYLKEYGIPMRILRLIRSMYNRLSCKILHEGKLTEHINVTNGVRQGCILSPTIFLLVLDSIMRKVTEEKKRGVQWGITSRLEDLNFADDICLLTQRLKDMKDKLNRLQEEADCWT